MKKVTLSVEEKLTYRREIEVEVPDEMDEAELERALDIAQREEMLGDFMHVLRLKGIKFDSYDDDLSSPDSSEVECEEYDFIEDEED